MSEEKNVGTDVALVLEALNFAAMKHRKHMRKDRETPYINHPIGVAHILASEGNISDPCVLQAAVLHDTVEDTDTTFDEIEEKFGSKIRSIVQEVTDDKTLSYAARKQSQIERAGKCSYEAKLIKLADKLHNLRDLLQRPPVDWDKKRIDGYFVWAADVVKQMIGTNKNLEQQLKLMFHEKGIDI